MILAVDDPVLNYRMSWQSVAPAPTMARRIVAF